MEKEGHALPEGVPSPSVPSKRAAETDINVLDFTAAAPSGWVTFADVRSALTEDHPGDQRLRTEGMRRALLTINAIEDHAGAPHEEQTTESLKSAFKTHHDYSPIFSGRAEGSKAAMYVRSSLVTEEAPSTKAAREWIWRVSSDLEVTDPAVQKTRNHRNAANTPWIASNFTIAEYGTSKKRKVNQPPTTEPETQPQLAPPVASAPLGQETSATKGQEKAQETIASLEHKISELQHTMGAQIESANKDSRALEKTGNDLRAELVTTRRTADKELDAMKTKLENSFENLRSAKEAACEKDSEIHKLERSLKQSENDNERLRSMKDASTKRTTMLNETLNRQDTQLKHGQSQVERYLEDLRISHASNKLLKEKLAQGQQPSVGYHWQSKPTEGDRDEDEVPWGRPMVGFNVKLWKQALRQQRTDEYLLNTPFLNLGPAAGMSAYIRTDPQTFCNIQFSHRSKIQPDGMLFAAVEGETAEDLILNGYDPRRFETVELPADDAVLSDGRTWAATCEQFDAEQEEVRKAALFTHPASEHIPRFELPDRDTSWMSQASLEQYEKEVSKLKVHARKVDNIRMLGNHLMSEGHLLSHAGGLKVSAAARYLRVAERYERAVSQKVVDVLTQCIDDLMVDKGKMPEGQ